MSKVNKKLKYPENLDVKKALRYGDVKVLAKKLPNYSYSSIHNILAGKMRMPDALAKEIIVLINERKQLQKELQEAILNK